MKLNKNSSIYFLGIGGIGMSALARYFKTKGFHVSGYDRSSTSLTKTLEKEGIDIHYHEDIHQIPINTELVIYTPAIPNTNKEYLHLLKSGLPIKKRAEVLGILSKDYFTIAVAGTHGKTSVSSIIAHILTNSEQECNAFLGGIAKNYSSNILLSETSKLLVIEADEYDRSFLHLHPNIALITSVDADHLDIYKNKDNLTENFEKFISQIKTGGTLFVNTKASKEFNKTFAAKTNKYALEEQTDIYAQNIRIENGWYIFDLVYKHGIIKNIKPGITGLFNIENCIAAIAIALELGVTHETIKLALSSFSGIKRRFEFHIREEELVYIDDYAHHPEELNACIKAVKRLYPEQKVCGIFQPHLYSRTRDFADEFAKSLEMLDEIILLEIYPAREQPIEGITSKMLLQKINHSNATICRKEKVCELLKTKEASIFLSMGAGDIDKLVDPIKETLTRIIK